MAYCTLPAESALKLRNSPDTRLLDMAWKPGEEEVLAGATSNGGRMWNMEHSGTEVLEFGTGTDMKWLAWSRDGNLLATVGEENVIWNSMGMRVATLQLDPLVFPARPPKFSPPVFNDSGRMVILSKLRSGTQDETGIYVFDALSGACLESMNFNSNWLTPIVWKNETEFFCGGRNMILHYQVGEVRIFKYPKIFGFTFSLAYNQKNDILAVAAGKTVRLLDPTMDLDPTMSVLTGHKSIVMEVVWHPHDSAVLAIIQRDGDVRIWDTQSKTTVLICESTGLDRLCYSPKIQFSPDGRFLSARGENAKIWRVTTGDIVAVCKVEGAEVSWNPKGDKLAVHSGRVFDLENIVGINLKVLSVIRVAACLKINIKNGKDGVEEFLRKQEIPEVLVTEVCTYLD